ncbi:unnamed protein product [Phaedon cochleariae]|uniref:Uncharacterized protein n=1 Tax=Phaedon cochleariae TaxID=80249 RepID=A0A9P0DRR1_PHACE|nr:unnamed protein product [Phaedon cochleariae]
MRQRLLVIIFFLIYSVNSGEMAEDCGGICNEDKLVGHLASMEVLSPESIFTLAFDDMEPLCKKLEENLKSTDSYLKTCKPSDQSELYVSLIRGVRVLNNKLCCTDNKFYKRYSMFHSCLRELTNDFESCNGPADWNEEPVKEKLCKTYKNIVDCYYIKAAKVCGKDAAKAVTELVQDVINSVLSTRCSGVNSLPYVKDAMPEKYINRNGSKGRSLYSVKLTLLASIINIVYYIFFQNKQVLM